MAPHCEDVARLGDGFERRIGLERAVFGSIRLLIHGDLVDLDLGETRNLQRHAFEDEVVQLELQLAEIPLALLAKAVDREPEKAPLGRS